MINNIKFFLLIMISASTPVIAGDIASEVIVPIINNNDEQAFFLCELAADDSNGISVTSISIVGLTKEGNELSLEIQDVSIFGNFRIIDRKFISDIEGKRIERVKFRFRISSSTELGLKLDSFFNLFQDQVHFLKTEAMFVVFTNVVQ